MSTLDPPEVAQPGSPDFFPSLLTRISAAAPACPIDTAILQSVLICLIAGRKNLLLRTKDEDIPLVINLTALILSSIFSLSSHRLRIRSSHPYSPANLLRAVFLPENITPAHELPSGEFPGYLHGQQRRSVSGSSLSSSKLRPKHNVKQLRAAPFARSSSSPSALNGSHEPCELENSQRFSAAYSSAPGLISDKQAGRPLPPSVGLGDGGAGWALPEALVISGLEHATYASQRAILRMLAEKRIAFETANEENDNMQEKWRINDENDRGDDGQWNLPPDFLMVYVCALDPRKRPKIHKTLLDQFAMSATVNLQPSIRQATHQHFPRRSPSSSPSLWQSHTVATHPYGVLPPNFLVDLRRLHAQIHLAPQLSLYISDLFSAARHHHELDGTFLTARSRKDVDDLVRAVRLVGRDMTGVEIIKGLAPSIRGEDQAVEDDESGGGPNDQGKTNRRHVASVNPSDIAWDATLDVSEADVARIVPRVLSHRLAVRHGPEDELLGSVLYGAVRDSETEQRTEADRSTVKDILVQILSEV